VTGTTTIGDVVPARALASAEDVLVTAPSRESLRGVPTGLLDAVASDGDGVITVTTRDSPRTVLDRIDRNVDGVSREHAAVVDLTPNDAEVRSNNGRRHWRLPSPMDLTGASMAVHECLAALFEDGVSTRHVLYDSLSRHLMGGDPETITKYTHQLVGLTSAPGSLGVYPVYTNTTGDDALDAITHVFGGVIHVRQRDGTRELRTRGLTDAPTDWTPIPAPAPDRIGDVEVH
jgi:KaiC/GvpD/RAD55 family RecA-like ATPase